MKKILSLILIIAFIIPLIPVHAAGNGSGINALADEMFVLNTIPSTSEITGWYNNTNSPSTFTTIGAEQGLTGSHVSFSFGTVSFAFLNTSFTFA